MHEILMPGQNSFGHMEVQISSCGATFKMYHYNGGVGMGEERWREVEMKMWRVVDDEKKEGKEGWSTATG